MIPSGSTEYDIFRKNRQTVLDVHRCNLFFKFPGDDNWRAVVHGDTITKTYGLENAKTRGAMSTMTVGLNYRVETTVPNSYTLTIIGINDKLKKLVNKVAKHNLDMGFRCLDKYTQKGFRFNFCNVVNFVGQTDISLGRESLQYQITFTTFEDEDDNPDANFDDDSSNNTMALEDAETPQDVFNGSL